MIAVVINWLILLVVSRKLSHDFSSLKSESVLSLTPSYWMMITKTLLGKRSTLYYGFMNGPILMEYLARPKYLRKLQSLLHTINLY